MVTTTRVLTLTLVLAVAAASPIGRSSDPDEWVEKRDMIVSAQRVFEDAAKTQIFEQRTMRDVAKLKAEMSTGQGWSELSAEAGKAKGKKKAPGRAAVSGTRFKYDLVQAGWGSSKPKTKTLSMDVDAKSMGASAGLCVQASVPSWVPHEIMNKGMNLIWNTKIGKRLAAGLSKHLDVQSQEFKVEERACASSYAKTLLAYTKNLPFVGPITFSIRGSAGFDKEEELAQAIGPTSAMDDLVQDGYGSWSKRKNVERSMDLDVWMAGVPKELASLMKQSICFQGTIPSWIPTSMLSAGMKLILEDKILEELQKKGMRIEPDKDTEFVATGPCDRKENPSSLLTYTKALPFVGSISFHVFGTEAIKQLKELFKGWAGK